MFEQASNYEYTTKNDRLNEIPFKEVGSEIKLGKEIKIDELAQKIFSLFQEDSDYSIAKSMPKIVESRTKQIRYKAQTNDFNQKFSIVIRERDNLITLKIKEPKDKKSADILSRNETEEILPYTTWTEEAELEVKNRQAKLWQIPTEFIEKKKEIQKEKLKIRIENKHTNRIYTIGLVTKRNISTEKITKFLEVNYVGREVPVQEIEKNAEQEITKDLLELKRILKITQK